MKNLILFTFSLVFLNSFPLYSQMTPQSMSPTIDIRMNAPDPSTFRDPPVNFTPPNRNVNVNVNSRREMTVLEALSLKIQTILNEEMPKYSNFYNDGHAPNMSVPRITDIEKDENGNQVLVGEYSYNNNYYLISGKEVFTPNQSFIFKATVKEIFNNYTINKIIYKKDSEWYRLFPEND